MSFKYFTKLLIKNSIWLLLIPTIIAFAVFYFMRSEKRFYSSETVIYTGIASGSSLNGTVKGDIFTTSNAFDNLISLINSRETKQEVIISLLSSHLQLKHYDPTVMSYNAYKNLQLIIPEKLRAELVKANLEGTELAIKLYLNYKGENAIYKLINSDNPYYSFAALENLKPLRVNNSDLIKISYQTEDALICKQTLELAEASFLSKQRSMKEGQSESVVAYFEKETDNAFGKLNEAEHRLLEFNKQNDIINYYEQTKSIAIERESLYALIHNLEMEKLANSKSLDKVNENIRGRTYQSEYGNAILKSKEQLADANNKISVDEIIVKNKSSYSRQLDSLRSLASNLDTRLKTSVNNLYSQTNTPQGIPTRNVLDEWLKTTLLFEQNTAKLTVMDRRKKDFEEQYKKYAPLGATIKKIEREINVSEQAYLELLHGLNMAKLTQQNNSMSSKMDIVDPPFLPLKANASKRILLSIIGWLGGFTFILAIILAKALLNGTLQKPYSSADAVGIKLLGIYPLLNSVPDFITKANLRLIQQVSSHLDMSTKPVTIGVISVQVKEGKTTIINLLEMEFKKLNYTVEKILWQQEKLIKSTADVVLIEFPPLDTMIMRPGFLPLLHHSFLVCRANRVWSKIDKSLLSIFSKTSNNTPYLLLNGVKSDFAEEYIGAIKSK